MTVGINMRKMPGYKIPCTIESPQTYLVIRAGIKMVVTKTKTNRSFVATLKDCANFRRNFVS